MRFLCALYILLFKRFKTRWQYIDRTAFEDSSTVDYTTCQHQRLRKLCILFSHIYAKGSIATKAPSNNLKLLKQLQLFRTINTNKSNAAVKKRVSQLWFLSEELVGLALFDNNLDNGTKYKMAMAMNKKEGKKYPLKLAAIDFQTYSRENCG